MKVVMKQSRAGIVNGLAFVNEIGDVVEVGDAEGERMIAAGQCNRYALDPPPAPETARAERAAEVMETTQVVEEREQHHGDEQVGSDPPKRRRRRARIDTRGD